MTSEATAFERQHFMVGPLHVFAENGAVPIDLDTVEILDVGRASPGRHQAVGRRPTILIGEDDAVAVAGTL